MPGMPYNNVQVMPDSDGDPSTGGHSRTVAASSAQRRMYFSWILRPDDTADIWKAVLSVGGDLSIDRLERALTVLYRRHDALRTTYLERNGEVLQVVQDADACRVAIEVVEAEGESSAERRDWADAEAARRVAAPIDLAAGPVGRVIVACRILSGCRCRRPLSSSCW